MGKAADNVQPLDRYLLHLVRLKGTRFIIVYEWMTDLPLNSSEVLTYASLVSLSTAHMKTRASDLGVFAQRTQRSVHRHLGRLERVGLVVRQAQYVGRRRAANAYRLLWHPAMPVELKGARCGTGDAPRHDPHDMSRTDKCDAGAVSPVSVQFMNASSSEEHAGRGVVAIEHDIPVPLRDALAKAAPGQLGDCLRVLREECSNFDVDRARRIKLHALQKLVARCEERPVNNPAGLLRACLLPDAVNQVDAVAANVRCMQEAIQRTDCELVSARNGFSVLRAMRRRATDVRSYVNQHVAAFGTEPEDVPPLPGHDPELAEVLSDVERLLERVRTARARNDATDANRAEEGLHQVERKLDELLQRRRG